MEKKLVKRKWNLDELPKFEKNFNQEHPDLAKMHSTRGGDLQKEGNYS